MTRTYKLGKMEASVLVIVQLAGAALCGLVALYLGYVSFTKWRLKACLSAGYAAYDQNQLATAETELGAALRWDATHTGARELLAKIKCDGDDFRSAEEHYGKLQNFDAPEVSAARGVLALKRADKAATAAEVQKLVAEAQAHFKAAASIPAGEVGLGYCELVLGRKAGKAAGLAAARAIFQRVRQQLEKGGDYARSLTRDAAVDFYMGLGSSLAADEATAGVAVSAFMAAHQYNPKWTIPYACRIAAVARRLSSGADATALKEIEAFHASSREPVLSNRDGMGIGRDAWINLTLNLGRAYGKLGKTDPFDKTLSQAVSVVEKGQSDPFLAEAVFRIELAMNEELDYSEWAKLAPLNAAAMNRAYDKVKGDATLKDAACRLLNAIAWMEAGIGVADPRQNRYALDHLKEAQKLFPDDYAVNRNILVVLKRMKPPPPPKEFEAYLEKAKAASAEHREDWDRVQQYLGGS